MPTQSKLSRIRILIALTAGLGAAFAFPGIFPAISRADMSDADYQAALKLVQKKALRLKKWNTLSASVSSPSGNALSSSLIRNLFGRMYRVGDQWDVAAWSFENTMARMTTDPTHLESKGGHGGIFHYEVTSVKTSPEPEVIILVTQLEEFGLKKPDARVRSLNLLMNDRMLQSRKTYRIEDREGKVHAVSVSPEGIHSSITRLELFPLDVPELLTADSRSTQAMPTLPEGLQAIASQASYHPGVDKSLSFDQDDFFGRGIQAIWRQGEPWPTYIKTSNGVSILIRKGAS